MLVPILISLPPCVRGVQQFLSLVIIIINTVLVITSTDSGDGVWNWSHDNWTSSTSEGFFTVEERRRVAVTHLSVTVQ